MCNWGAIVGEDDTGRRCFTAWIFLVSELSSGCLPVRESGRSTTGDLDLWSSPGRSPIARERSGSC